MVHGGAGRYRGLTAKRARAIKRALVEALVRGYEAMDSGDAVDGVVEAVRVLEDSGLFNAGRGSVLNVRGYVEMDASVMSGDLRAGAVAAVRRVRNPILLARLVMERTDHVLLIGDWVEKLAEAFGLALEDHVSSDKLSKWLEIKAKVSKGEGMKHLRKLKKLMSERPDLFEPLGTVGAVALDRQGRVAAASSTGGYWLKLPGRVGDTPIIGAGLYADNEAGAATATGIGEYIMKTLLSYRAVSFMAQGASAQDAVEKCISLVTRLFGTGTAGLIAIDVKGFVGMAYNTRGMARGVLSRDLLEPIVAVP